MRIVIPHDYQNIVKDLVCFKKLEGHSVTILNSNLSLLEQLNDTIIDTEVLVLIRERTSITEELLSILPNLKLISQTGKISKHIDLNACTKYKVAVTEGVGSPIAPAELTWNLILNSRRQIIQAIEGMKKGLWQTNIGRALHGQTIGIWGYGKIGQKICTYAKAFEMNVVVWGSHNSRIKAEMDGFKTAKTKEEFFSSVDILTLHLRLSESTKYIIRECDLALMKPDSLLVNISRAELIEKKALLNALEQGRPGYAALDVYENEPILDPNYALLKMKNVICTPHLGYVEYQSYEFYFSQAFENILSFAEGKPQNIINVELFH